MTEVAGPAGRGPRGTLGPRLALIFLAVALVAVALLAGLAAAFASADVSALASKQRNDLTSAIAVATGAAWDRNDSWAGADLSPVLDLAARTGAGVQVRALGGHHDDRRGCRRAQLTDHRFARHVGQAEVKDN